MPIDYPGVPIIPGLLPQNLNAQIAQGADPGSVLGAGTEGYFKGQEQGYQQRQRNLFRGGLPKVTDAQGNPVLDAQGQPTVDWNAVSEQLARAQGAPAIQNIIGLRGLELEQQALSRPPPSLYGSGEDFGPGTGGAPAAARAPAPNVPPSTAVQAQPLPPGGAAAATPGTTDYTPAPSVIARANTGGIPQAVQQPTPAQQVQARFQPTSPAIPPGGGTPAQPAPPTQVAQAQPQATPYGQPDPMEIRATQLGDYFAEQARALGFNPNSKAASEGARNQADRYYAIAQQLREQRLKAALGTPEMQNARAAGAANPLQYQQQQEVQKLAVARSEKLYGGITASAQQYATDLAPYNQIARSILNDPRAYTGAGADQALDINRIRALWSASGRTEAQLQEMLQKVRAASVLSQINTQRFQVGEAGQNSSRIFSSQIEQVEKASPGLETTLQGNRALINIQTRMGELQGKIAELARNYRAQHAGILDDGFDRQLADYMQANPVFTKQEQMHPEWLGAPDAPQGLSPEQYVQWGARMGLKPDDVVRTPGGYARIPRLTVPLNPANVQ